MVFLTIYYMSWGLSYFYENSQLESDNVIRLMQCAQVMEGLLSIENEFSDHLFYRNFFFTYIMKIFMVFLTMYYMSWGLSYFYENSQFEN